MARKYNVEGTKTFLYWSLGLLALGLWCVKDGWFPAPSKEAAKTAQEFANFILFNKSLAILCLAGAAVCAYIHKVVK